MSQRETVGDASLPGLGPLPVRKRAASVAQRLRAVTAQVYVDPGFVAWWAEYPNKGHKPEAAEAWYLAGAVGVPALAQAIRVGCWAWRRSWAWQKDRGAYVPRPDRFLAQRLWESPPADLRRGLPASSTWRPPDLPRPDAVGAGLDPAPTVDAEALVALEALRSGGAA